jgi:hypothetical protein
MARIGGVCATFMGVLAETNEIIPPILFGSVALISAFLSTMLPETGGHPLPKDLEDIKAREKEDRENGFINHAKNIMTKTRRRNVQSS